MTSSTFPDSVSLRVDYSLPILVRTKSGMKASGYDLKRFVLAHRIDVVDFQNLFGGDAQKLWEMIRSGFEAKLEAEAAGWKVTFKGLAILRHSFEETPEENDPRWT